MSFDQFKTHSGYNKRDQILYPMFKKPKDLNHIEEIFKERNLEFYNIIHVHNFEGVLLPIESSEDMENIVFVANYSNKVIMFMLKQLNGQEYEQISMQYNIRPYNNLLIRKTGDEKIDSQIQLAMFDGTHVFTIDFDNIIYPIVFLPSRDHHDSDFVDPLFVVNFSTFGDNNVLGNEEYKSYLKMAIKERKMTTSISLQDVLQSNYVQEIREKKKNNPNLEAIKKRENLRTTSYEQYQKKKKEKEIKSKQNKEMMIANHKTVINSYKPLPSLDNKKVIYLTMIKNELERIQQLEKQDSQLAVLSKHINLSDATLDPKRYPVILLNEKTLDFDSLKPIYQLIYSMNKSIALITVSPFQKNNTVENNNNNNNNDTELIENNNNNNDTELIENISLQKVYGFILEHAISYVSILNQLRSFFSHGQKIKIVSSSLSHFHDHTEDEIIIKSKYHDKSNFSYLLVNDESNQITIGDLIKSEAISKTDEIKFRFKLNLNETANVFMESFSLSLSADEIDPKNPSSFKVTRRRIKHIIERSLFEEESSIQILLDIGELKGINIKDEISKLDKDN